MEIFSDNHNNLHYNILSYEKEDHNTTAHAHQQQRSLPDRTRYATVVVDEVVVCALAQLQYDILSTLAVARQLVVF